MKTSKFVTSVGLLAIGVTALSSAPAQAFSFQADYTKSLTGGAASKGDIFLNSITLESGRVIDDFTLVTSANILSNDLYTGGNSGAASADIGDLATTGLREEALTNAGAAAVMSNLNLNNIIDTEDKGNFILDLNFDQAVDNIFLWERGKNSKLDIQALDANGNEIGNLIKLDSKKWDNAGFKINTKEIGGSQKVGSIGLGLEDFGITNGFINSVRVTSKGKSYNGPDFKLLGSVAEQDIPEPSSLLGLGAIVAGAFATRKRKQAQAG